MNYDKLLINISTAIVAVLFLSACGLPAGLLPVPTSTPLPTLTPYPTYTALPPTATSTPIPGIGEWVEGHFFSIKVVDVYTATDLDGERPIEDIFVVVVIDWKVNSTPMWHGVMGSDFELVDEDGKIYELSGMIVQPDNADEKYDEGTYRTNKIRGSASNTYKIAYDVPSSVKNLRLWFQDFPVIDLGLELP